MKISKIPMVSKFKKFEEFEGEIIKYSDYLGQELNESLGEEKTDTPLKSWTVEDSQQLSSQLVGVKHPWTRDQYEEFTHPDVKQDISYEEYIKMWNSKAPEDQRVILEKSGRGFNVDRLPSKQKAAKRKPGTTTPYDGSSGGYGTSAWIATASSGDTYADLPGPVLYDRNSDRSFKINPNPTPKPVMAKTEEEKSGWSRIKLETRIMIVTMIIGVILSFITVVILMLK